MNTVDLLAEVELRCKESLAVHTLDKLKMSHTYGSRWRVCACNYCTLKRRATYEIGSIDNQTIIEYRSILGREGCGGSLDFSFIEIKDIIRNKRRTHYRKLLKELI